MTQADSEAGAIKQAVKEALVETLREQRELLHDVFAEVLEDFALAEAVREGRKTKKASREEVSRAARRVMDTTFRKSFARDLKKMKIRDVLDRVRQVIEEVELAPDLQSIRNLKKMSGTEDFYRIRVGEHRIGIVVEGETVEFVRCLPRRDLYRFFP